MKKKLVSICLLLFLNSLNAQSVIERLQAKFCECISVAAHHKTGIDDKKFDDCWDSDSVFKKAVTDSLASIDPTDNEDDSYKWGRQFFENNQLKFILECDAWYYFIDSSRYNFLSELDTNLQLKKIDTINQFLKKNGEQSDYYRQRGMAYFSLSKLDEAKKDFDKALSMSNASTQNLYFRGWIAELKGNYDEALADYKLAKELSGVQYIDNLIGIAERKKREAAKKIVK